MKNALLALLGLMATAKGQANRYSPLLGPVFPHAANFSSNNAFHDMTMNLTTTLEDIILAGNSTSTSRSVINSEDTSFALQIFSSDTIGMDNGNNTLFQWFYTSPATQNSSSGVKEVDENTVFRIGSGSKLWTVLLFLVTAGEAHLHDPVTKWVPELQAAINAAPGDDSVDYVSWEDVTIQELASHLSGVGRDYAFSDLATMDPDLTGEGFPSLSKNETPPCGVTAPCTRAQFFDGITNTHPIAPTSYTPIYSNAAIQILSYALEAITNETYDALLEEYLFEPLGLNSSYYTVPADNVGIIPRNASTSLWNLSAGDETPAGGLYASIKDLSTVGRAILNNALLSPATTRRWLKPITHTASPSYSVGAPWEIYSFENVDGRTVDLYTKSGDLGAYSSMTALLPDYNIGFTILAAGPGTTELVAALTDAVAQSLIPALELAAREKARQIYTGVYSGQGTDKKNSSLVISMDNGPGLKVTQWVSDSQDMLQVAEALTGSDSLEVRLYPTALQQKRDGSCLMQSFRAVFGSPTTSNKFIGPVTGSSISWEFVDSYKYGNVGVDEFLFELDTGTGKVVSVSPRALRQTLQKA
ncbi:beta-lactamase, putative [Talaromyces stipitatus ATCC 10500]|uniref:Beta-lactamase, putative n=1 Tax=Talaromyces stipitatus (strain ATCC 10500 / CBS 375.48 / QM 6759 / NRRL 1006) TaxID=441959 RepID=B8ME36_TALSN|nr:beta-lactamase, putative [Talaromyces stipitatus ATCC 10500]EED16113.1 beta-lactamase, putative [Talaromyces stipitatus ATCC 10500]